MRSVPRCCALPFARPRAATAAWALSPTRSTLRRAAGQAAVAALPQGSLAPERGSVVPLHHGLLRPHPSVSRARDDFTAWPLIRRAFAVRERLGDPRDLPYFHCPTVQACRRPYTGGFERLSRCACASRCQASSLCPRVATHDHRLCQLCPAGSTISVRHRSRYAAARLFALPS
jgi:hypothetical protein